MLSLNNVSVAYQKTQAVQDVTFELGVGEIGCLLGPSGCGKTSLLRAVAGFPYVTSWLVLSIVTLSLKSAVSQWCFKITRCFLI